MCKRVARTPGCVRGGKGGGTYPWPPQAPCYSAEETSTTGTSTRAWEGAVGARAPAGFPKTASVCRKTQRPLGSAKAVLRRPRGGRGVQGCRGCCHAHVHCLHACALPWDRPPPAVAAAAAATVRVWACTAAAATCLLTQFSAWCAVCAARWRGSTPGLCVGGGGGWLLAVGQSTAHALWLLVPAAPNCRRQLVVSVPVGHC